VSVSGHHPQERPVARALSESLDQALGSVASRAAVSAAREAAQLLDLRGLDRALSVCLPHAGRPWPNELRPLIGVLKRLTQACADSGSLAPFQGSEAEITSLSERFMGLQWSEAEDPVAERRAAIHTLTLADVLEDIPVAAGPSRDQLRDLRLTAPVGAALRAALDWLAEESGVPRTLRLRVEEAALDVICERVNGLGLRPAHEVLSSIGGSLGPATPVGDLHPPGAWMLRVPLFTGRDFYLMLVQGGTRLALPWHSVLRLCMVPADELRTGIGTLTLPMLDPMVRLEGSTSEYPVVLVGHGLKRGYIVADRLVWRLPAERCRPEESPPAAGLSRTVCTEEGEVFWALEPGRLLESVKLPSLPELGLEPVALQTLPVLGPADVEPLMEPSMGPSMEPSTDPGMEPLAVPFPEVPETAAALSGTTTPEPGEAEAWVPESPAAGPLAAIEPPEPVLAPAAREPLAPESPEALAPAPEPRELDSAARPEPVELPEATPASGPRALVVEDSITARVFVTRLLEQSGFLVRAVTTAAELFAELKADPWAVILVDVELPDAQGTDFLRTISHRLEEGSPRTALVALVRDAADAALAREAGLIHTLSKPVDPEKLIERLSQLGLAHGDVHDRG